MGISSLPISAQILIYRTLVAIVWRQIRIEREIDRDSDAPLLIGARGIGSSTIVLDFNEAVQLGNVGGREFYYC